MKTTGSRPRFIAFALFASLAFATGAASADATEAKEGKARHGHGMFQRIDANKDGKITKAEAKNFADARFSKMDANKDGAITKAEAKKFHEERRAEHQKKRAEHQKKRGDKEGKKECDGKKGMKHAKNGGRFFKKADSNNDGKVTRAEAASMEENRFARLDANKDGVITQAEAKAAHKARRSGSRSEHKQRGPKGQAA